MDSLFLAALNSKICAKCGQPKLLKLFPKINDWCRLCLKRAHGAAPPGKKFCTLYCKDYLPLSAFDTRATSDGGVQVASACKACASKRAVKLSQQKYDAIEARDKNLQNNHGLTLAEYTTMLAEQGGVCAICKKTDSVVIRGKLMPLVVDHCHTTGAIRGLLCDYCNHALSLVKEDPGRAKALLQYIEDRCLW